MLHLYLFSAGTADYITTHKGKSPSVKRLLVTSLRMFVFELVSKGRVERHSLLGKEFKCTLKLCQHQAESNFLLCNQLITRMFYTSWKVDH